MLNVTQVHLDTEIAVSPPKVVAPPFGDAVWSVTFRKSLTLLPSEVRF